MAGDCASDDLGDGPHNVCDLSFARFICIYISHQSKRHTFGGTRKGKKEQRETFLGGFVEENCVVFLNPGEFGRLPGIPELCKTFLRLLELNS